VRPPLEENLPAVLELVNEHAPEPFDAAAIRQEWSAPRVELERDARIEDGAYVLVESLDDARVWLQVHGRPSRELLDWAEARASEMGSRVFSGAWSPATHLLEGLEARGFRHVCSLQRMLIDLAEPVSEARWPPGIAVRTLEHGDEQTFYEVHQESFEDSWEPVRESYEEWSHWLLGPSTFAPDLWFLAHEDGEPAGIAICHQHRSRADLGWVNILGVRRAWRRRGLGRALLLHAFEEFRRRGMVVAGLGVDAESVTGAHRLYQEVGMRVAARFDIYEKAAP
jgi:GNAT superfamily N-acetyltransferase